MTWRPETRAAIAAARTAGRILDRWFGRVGPVRLKSARDPVTRADGASERAIRRLLGRRFPTIGFLGEEGGTVATGPDGRWIVDPLDGTIAFVAGLPTFGVSIALERRGRLEVGVMLFPRLHELFVAERGRGAWLNGRRIRVTRTRDMARSRPKCLTVRSTISSTCSGLRTSSCTTRSRMRRAHRWPSRCCARRSGWAAATERGATEPVVSSLGWGGGV